METEFKNTSAEDTFEFTDSVVVEALDARKKADELRGAAIIRLRAVIDQAQRSLKALGCDYQGAPNGNGTKGGASTPKTDSYTDNPDKKRFATMKLADAGKIILQERGQLHGSEIERLVKIGGFKSKSETFQTYLRTAFQRAGGVENVGQNTWRLNDQIPAKPLNGSGE